MFVELAQLDIKPGQEAAFETQFAKAAPLIRRSKGCRGVELQRGVEKPSRYRLLVQWDTVENHVVDFVNSPECAETGTLLSPYFDGEPQVEHISTVLKLV